MDRLAGRIQHTLVRPGVTRLDIERHCEECLVHGLHAAMVPGRWVGLTRHLLDGSGVLAVSAADFPHGGMTRAGRVAEVRALESEGAQEIDIGIPVGLLASGDDQELEDDISAVVAAVSVPVKAMLELPLLSDDEKLRVVRVAVAAGVAFVKNASGGEVGVATEADIRFLRANVPDGVRVKASGGIKTRSHAEALIAAGADLVGTSAAIAILTGVTTVTRDADGRY